MTATLRRVGILAGIWAATWALIATSCLGLLSAPAEAQDTEATKTLQKLLDKSGVKYVKNGVAFVAVFKGKVLEQIPILLLADDDTLILIAVIAKKEQFKKTPELVEKLAMASMEHSLLKVGLVKAGDMVVRVDALLDTLDSDDLEKLLKKTASGADKVRKQFADDIQ